MDEGYTFVRREQLSRYAVLQLDVKGRDVDGFVKEADAKIRSQVKLPEGYWIEWGGAFENQQRAMARLAVIVPLTIGLIFILLYTAFNSLAHAALIIANVPFAVIGGVFGLAITGQYVSVPSAIGFIAVFGVAMLNGIVLVSFLNDRRRQGFSIREAVREGRGAAPAAGADDRLGGDPRPGPDAALPGCRRGDAAAAGHRRGRRAVHLHRADAAAAAAHVRMAGNPGERRKLRS
jgi:hypothetical protein